MPAVDRNATETDHVRGASRFPRADSRSIHQGGLEECPSATAQDRSASFNRCPKETRTDVRSGFRLPLLDTPDGYLARSHRLLQPTRHRPV